MNPFAAYEITKGIYALDALADQPAKTDDTALSARFVISTTHPDRDGDVVDVQGIDTSFHQSNPVVFFEHRKMLPFPIALSQTPDGVYTVELSNDFAYGTAYFKPDIRESVQIYELVKSGLLRCASIGFIPREISPRLRGGRGAWHKKIELTEWSIVGVPANPHALRSELRKSLLAGSPISAELKLALEPYTVEKAKAWAPGATLDDPPLKATATKTVLGRDGKLIGYADGLWCEADGTPIEWTTERIAAAGIIPQADGAYLVGQPPEQPVEKVADLPPESVTPAADPPAEVEPSEDDVITDAPDSGNVPPPLSVLVTPASLDDDEVLVTVTCPRAAFGGIEDARNWCRTKGYSTAVWLPCEEGWQFAQSEAALEKLTDWRRTELEAGCIGTVAKVTATRIPKYVRQSKLSGCLKGGVLELTVTSVLNDGREVADDTLTIDLTKLFDDSSSPDLEGVTDDPDARYDVTDVLAEDEATRLAGLEKSAADTSAAVADLKRTLYRISGRR